MLRVVQQSSSEAAKKYYSRSDYLSEGQELVGNWGGKGAERLGLSGIAQKRDFDMLCDNLNPRTGERLTARNNGERTCGYDFNFSVPKSVSLLYAMTEDKGLLDAFRSSIDETMRDIEAEMKTRIRKGGQETNRLTGNGIWATFYHFTSRPVDGVPDPHLHAHCFVFNSTFDSEEQRWKAGQFRDLKRDAPYFQAVFRARLANRLQELGYAVQRKKDDFELAGFDKETLKRFSRRTEKIEQLADELGIVDPKVKDGLGKSSRERKNDTLSWKQLREAWGERLSPKERQTISSAHVDRSKPITIERGEKAAVDHALLHCFERDSVVRERELKAEALRNGLGRVGLAELEREFARRKLIALEVEGERFVTTPEILEEERQLVSFARQGRGTALALGGFDREFKRDWLNEQQKRAVRHMWESPDRVILFRGAAGTGKTTLLQEAAEGIESNGYRVVALAPSAEAARGVLREEARFKNADTVAKFLIDRELQASARNGVILIDEVSLVGARTLAHVVKRAKELNARLILVGDPKQHSSVERGGAAFRLLTEDAALPVVEVTDILRQEKAEYKRAMEALSAGRTLEGFMGLDALGWVHEIGDGERENRLAADYLVAASERKANGQFKNVLVVSPTHAEAGRITQAIRTAMKEKGLLGEERTMAVWSSANLTEAERGDADNYSAGEMLQFHKAAPGHQSGDRLIVADEKKPPVKYADRFQVYRPGEISVAVGDKLRVTANGTTRDGHRLNNGSSFVVKRFTPRGDIVDERGWVIDRDFGHLAHGYVFTSPASQGKTVDKVLVCQSSASGRAASAAQFYVSASRARESVTVYTDDKEALRQAIQGDVPRLSATELTRWRRDHNRRLQRHLAFARRQCNFERTQNPVTPPLPVKVPERELQHAR